MSFFGWGNRSINSTTLGLTSNPTTATIVAELVSSALRIPSGGGPYQVTWIVGAQTTLATFQLEQTLSTGLDMSTAGRDQAVVMVSSGQSAQFVTKHNLEEGDRLRVRMNSSLTGAVAAKIIAEPLA